MVPAPEVPLLEEPPVEPEPVVVGRAAPEVELAAPEDPAEDEGLEEPLELGDPALELGEPPLPPPVVVDVGAGPEPPPVVLVGGDGGVVGGVLGVVVVEEAGAQLPVPA